MFKDEIIKKKLYKKIEKPIDLKLGVRMAHAQMCNGGVVKRNPTIPKKPFVYHRYTLHTLLEEGGVSSALRMVHTCQSFF
jgi:hypothetical protein